MQCQTALLQSSIIAGNFAQGSTEERNVRTKEGLLPSAAPSAGNNYSIIGYTAGYTAQTIFGTDAPTLADNGGKQKPFCCLTTARRSI